MANHLATETSPYLQQHAGNPVDWYPWGEHALTLARAGARPILLSIGYSACHWCHVMAHESFEDPATAAVMNELFVNIKVDREERPDLDQIYQTAHQMLTGRPGGWPLTMFLTSDGTPFFGGTYFPNVPRHGLPAFAELCRDVAETHRRRPNDIAEQNRELRRLLAATVPRPTKLSLGGTGLQVRDALLQHYDPRYGGFGGAPKFPQASDLAFLLCAAGAGDAAARDAVLTTLRRMAQGGLYDQLGGGFFRYSVDERWEIPHFEKMLYDNGQLLGLYADAWQVSGDSLFSRVVMETADWAMRDMQLPGGGFASSLDADTEGEEGGYYVWQESEIRSQLADAEWRLASRSWGLDRPANFEDSAWHLQLVAEPDPADLPLLDSARAKLRAARGQRVPPGRDDKVLTAWNALMIDGLARAGMIFGKVEWLAAARRAFEFVQTTLWQNGRLLATARDGRAHLPAYLDDYAFLLLATESLIAAEFRPADLVFARTLADALLAHFEDKTDGGFFFTAHDHEALIHRPKPVFDNPLPGSNAAAARALLRLGGRMGEPRYLDAATRCLQLFQQHIERSAGFGVATLAMALDELQETPSAAPVCTATGCVLPS